MAMYEYQKLKYGFLLYYELKLYKSELLCGSSQLTPDGKPLQMTNKAAIASKVVISGRMLRSPRLQE